MNTSLSLPAAPYQRSASNAQVSDYCLDPNPKPYGRKEKTNNSPLQKHCTTHSSLRFDDMACMAVSLARADLFVDANRLETDAWIAPTIAAQLEEIHTRVWQYGTTAKRQFRALLAEKDLSLALCVIQGFSEQPEEVRICDNSIFPLPPEGGAFSVDIIYKSASTHIPRGGLLFPAYRRRIAQRKFSLPNGSFVTGPYLGVIAFEPSTRLVVRARLIPVWLSPNRQTMNPIRSRLERGMHVGVYDFGSVGYSSLAARELPILQRGLGHRWTGDISAYHNNPDLLVLPKPGCLVSVAELFAIRAMKRYDETQRNKVVLGEHLTATSLLNFIALKAQKYRLPLEIEQLVSRQLATVPSIWTRGSI